MGNDGNDDGKDDRPATLLIAAVPIGRPEDASPRLAAALSEAGIIAAEDTRRVRRLAAALDAALTARIVSYYDEVETRRAAGLLAELRAGHDVLLVSDAGMPGVSDPGYRIVAAAAAEGIRVSVLPGPSAVTAALAVSGLPSDRFCFEGFPPRKAGERARRFAELAPERRTMVFFESPRRLGVTLTGLGDAFGADRPAVAQVVLVPEVELRVVEEAGRERRLEPPLVHVRGRGREVVRVGERVLACPRARPGEHPDLPRAGRTAPAR